MAAASAAAVVAAGWRAFAAAAATATTDATATTTSSVSATSSSSGVANSTASDNSAVALCEDNPSTIQPWTGIDLTEPSSIFNLEFHTYAWVACGVCAFLATVISIVLIFKHLRNFNVPRQQAPIVRILFIVPVYAIISWFSFRYYWRAVYYNVIRDTYEAFVVYSFFVLVMQFLGDTVHVQRMALADKPKKLRFPIPFFFLGHFNPTTPTFLPRVRALVLQYALVKPATTIMAVITQALSRYCSESMSPAYGHFWYMVFNFVSVGAAMYGLIVIYVTIKDDIAEHKPLPKFLSIKLVILLTMWQNMLLSLLVHFKAIPATQFWTRTNVANGIQSMLVCVEMLGASIFHHYSFSSREYEMAAADGSGAVARTRVWPALLRCLNVLDVARDVIDSGRHLMSEAKGTAIRTDQDNVELGSHLRGGGAGGSGRSSAKTPHDDDDDENERAAATLYYGRS